MGTVVAYWHREGLDIYRLVHNRPVKLAGGELARLAPFRGIADKKILIIGRERLFHLKKRYPPAPEEALRKAVSLEIGELVPFSSPAYFCQVFESYSSHVLMDIWAWKTDEYQRLREIFPFGAAVPEDLLFTASEPEMAVYQSRGMLEILAYGGGKYFDGTAFPADTVSKDDLGRFIQGLAQYRVDVKKIKVYGSFAISFGDLPHPDILSVPMPPYPPCLESLPLLEFRRFRVKRDHAIFRKKAFIFRIVLYLVIGYAAMLFLTLNNYDNALQAIKQRTAAIDKQVATMVAAQTEISGENSGVAKDLEEKISARRSTLSTLNTLAQRLPRGSYINRMVLIENNADISLSSKEPLMVIRMLGEAPEIKKVSLKGPPVKDRNATLYSFNMTIEFNR